MNEDLKRCPFCGGYANFEYRNRKDGKRDVCVSCRNCGAQTMWYVECDLLTAQPDKYTPMYPDIYEPYSGKADAADHWNRRANELNEP